MDERFSLPGGWGTFTVCVYCTGAETQILDTVLQNFSMLHIYSVQAVNSGICVHIHSTSQLIELLTLQCSS